jgi:acid phosphatase (class A)
MGWALALVPAEISPDQADAIIARGRAYGESRIVSNLHWQSHVNEGRFIDSATFARLYAEPAFRADLETAREEVESVRVKGLKLACKCEMEKEDGQSVGEP